VRGSALVCVVEGRREEDEEEVKEVQLVETNGRQ
jgi:hypothetical protein